MNCRGDEDIDAKRSRPSIGKPVMGHARKERVVLFGTDQRITSGPAAKRPHSKAEYMTAPERFADSQIPLAPRAPSIHDPKQSIWRNAQTGPKLCLSNCLFKHAGSLHLFDNLGKSGLSSRGSSFRLSRVLRPSDGEGWRRLDRNGGRWDICSPCEQRAPPQPAPVDQRAQTV